MGVGNVATPAVNISSTASPQPRQAEVNARLENQTDRIQDGFDDGQLTSAQAKQLHGEDKDVRKQEVEMASLDGGHITKADKVALNQELDSVSKQIYLQRHGGSSA
jgi:hypothetical protein